MNLQPDEPTDVLPHLFHTEFSKMVAVITRLFGLQHIQTAEDIVSETFLLATETWKTKPIPSNPAAWLYAVAKQKTLSYLRRHTLFTSKVLPHILESSDSRTDEEPDFSVRNIQDSQLKMLFAVCHPAIASEAQIGLALRILCGFGIEEIAEAFLSNKETINKRLYRAREKLRKAIIQVDELLHESTIEERLDNVLHIIYLLFNEGYYSTTQQATLRKDFCLEALRLGLLLTEYRTTNTPKANALVALMCFHASRLDARQTGDNSYILYENQNEALWNKPLIIQGNRYLQIAAQGSRLSSYHLEAGIAFWHCQKEDTAEKWSSIVHHYNLLLAINFSPLVALNRVYALYKLHGSTTALAAAEQLSFTSNPFYFSLLGELYKNIDTEKAICYLEKAVQLATRDMDKQILLTKICSLKKTRCRFVQCGDTSIVMKI